MSATTASAAPQGLESATPAAPVSRKAAIGLSLLAIVGTILFGILSGTKSASFGLVDTGREASAVAAWLAFAVALAAAGWFGYLWVRDRRPVTRPPAGSPGRWPPPSWYSCSRSWASRESPSSRSAPPSSGGSPPS